MKRLRILALMMLVAAGFTGCQTEPVDPAVLDNNPIDVPGDASFTVKIGGENFVADQAQAVIDEGVIAVAGIRGNNGETVSFIITGSGENTFSGEDVLFSYDPSAESEYTYNNYTEDGEANGSVTITEIDAVNHTISGTFQFTGYYSNFDVVVLPTVFSNGQFTDIPYTDSLVEPGDEEYFRAKIDGQLDEYGIFGAAEANGALSITGSDVLSNLNIFIGTETQPGTYAFSSELSDPPTGIYTVDGVDYTSVSGTLTIISNDGDFIKGEFNFAATNEEGDTIEITDGEFNVELF